MPTREEDSADIVLVGFVLLATLERPVELLSR